MAKFYAVDANGNSALLSMSIGGFTQSLQQNGWCKLPNGLILQWRRDANMVNGSFPDSFYNNEIVPFPVSFTLSPFICVLGVTYFTMTYPGYRCPITKTPQDGQNTVENWSATSVELAYSYDKSDWEYMINYQLFLGV